MWACGELVVLHGSSKEGNGKPQILLGQLLEKPSRGDLKIVRLQVVPMGSMESGVERDWEKDCELQHENYYGTMVDFLDITHKRIRDSLKRFVCGGVKYGPSPLVQRLLFASGSKALESGLLPGTLTLDDAYHNVEVGGSTSSKVAISKDGIPLTKTIPRISFSLDSANNISQVNFFPFARVNDNIPNNEQGTNIDTDNGIPDISYTHSRWQTDIVESEAFYSLNLQQRDAVQQAVAGPITLIEGPPGSGKTRVAAGIVEQWRKHDKESIILVAAGTRAAVRNLSVSIAKVCGQDALIHPFQNSRNPRDQNANILVTTLFQVGGTLARLGGKAHRVLVDEATQVPMLQAMLVIEKSCEHLVLVGDPNQLPPISLTAKDAYGKKEFGHDIGWENIFELLLRTQKENLRHVQLETQFRMHPAIVEFPSQRFYGGRISSTYTEEIAGGSQWPSYELLATDWFMDKKCSLRDLPPVLFLDTADFPAPKSRDFISPQHPRSLQNPDEADLVVMFLDLLRNNGVEDQNIGIVAPYLGQRDLLQEKIHGEVSDPIEIRMKQLARSRAAAEGSDPMVNTVDAFQGSERDYILFSPTRHSSYKGGMSGFLEDRKRVCVLLTRARKGFVCFGDSRMLKKHPLWQDWLEHVQENGGYLRVVPHIV